jgi:hypothetical protein
MKSSCIAHLMALAVVTLGFGDTVAAGYPTIAPVAPGKPFPIYRDLLRGTNGFRVINPGKSQVRVALRNGTKGITFDVPPLKAMSVAIPEGTFDVYLLYSDRPAAAFKAVPVKVDRRIVELLLSADEPGGYSLLEAWYPK